MIVMASFLISFSGCGTTRKIKEKNMESRPLSEMLKLTLRLEQDTINNGDPLSLILTWENISDTIVVIYPESTRSFGPQAFIDEDVGHPSTPIFIIRETTNYDSQVILLPGEQYTYVDTIPALDMIIAPSGRRISGTFVYYTFYSVRPDKRIGRDIKPGVIKTNDIRFVVL